MKKFSIILLILTLAGTAWAHEYILLAADFVVQRGAKLEMRLFVADGFNIERERSLEHGMTKGFGLISAQGETDLLARSPDGAWPVLDMTVDFQGLGLVHMERDYARISLPNDRFLRYLRSDNIEGIRIDDSTRTEQSERYSRYLKALVQSDFLPNDTLYKRVLGQAFEIVLLQNPYEMHLGDWIQAQVFFQGAPLPNKVITARNRLGGDAAISQYARTDAAGICTFKLERAGEWFFHATHMIPCPDPDDVLWESFWTAYSFGLAAEVGE